MGTIALNYAIQPTTQSLFLLHRLESRSSFFFFLSLFLRAWAIATSSHLGSWIRPRFLEQAGFPERNHDRLFLGCVKRGNYRRIRYTHQFCKDADVRYEPRVFLHAKLDPGCGWRFDAPFPLNQMATTVLNRSFPPRFELFASLYPTKNVVIGQVASFHFTICKGLGLRMMSDAEPRGTNDFFEVEKIPRTLAHLLVRCSLSFSPP